MIQFNSTQLNNNSNNNDIKRWGWSHGILVPCSDESSYGNDQHRTQDSRHSARKSNLQPPEHEAEFITIARYWV
jgi:hypothetical protein